MKHECDSYTIPLKVRFGEMEYLDEELTSETFYRYLGEKHELPKTVAAYPRGLWPSIAVYISKLLEEYQEIISVHLSSALSGTCSWSG